jgi:hypothetical protein
MHQWFNHFKATQTKPTTQTNSTTQPSPCPPPQEREDGLTEWDRFARTEYLRLAMEEDADNDNASDGAWSRLDAL